MRNLIINTYQNVNLNVKSDILGWRILSFIIDFIILGLYIIGIAYFFSSIYVGSDEMMGLFASLTLMPVYFYSLYMEFFFNGQTIGKMLCKLKVIKINGYHPQFIDYFTRWIFRLIDIYIFIFFLLFFGDDGAVSFLITGLPAFFSIITSKQGQRLGDKIAGTSVVRLVEHKDFSQTIFTEISQEYRPTYPQVIKLTDQDMRIIKDTHTNANLVQDFDTLRKLRERLETVLDIKSEQGDNSFINTVIKDFNYYTKDIK